MTTLDQMHVAESAKIIGYDESHNSGFRQKLLAMGLTPNTEITLLNIAPLGCPFEIKVRGVRLSLRKDEAKIIMLKKL